MTKEKLERANKLSEWIDKATNELSEISECIRLYTTRKDENDKKSLHLVSILGACMTVTERWNYESGASSDDRTLRIEGWIVVKALKTQEEYLKECIQKAQDEFDSL